ncbi:MAG: hypothetical protein ACLVAW_14095 [Eisenbergiella massiliensis]
MRDKETEKFERVGRSYILLVLAAGIILPLVASLIMCIVMGEIRGSGSRYVAYFRNYDLDYHADDDCMG